ncbi:MAG: hypothetical protein ACYTHM_11540 [Planctomycetota bacterium]|jgi:hypothetical protein
MGGRGQGKGGVAPESDADGIKFKTTRLSGRIDPRGRVIASRYFRGLPEKGEAAAEYRNVFQNYEKMARHSLNKEEIPLGYREYIKQYFDSVCPKENE